MKLCLSIGMLPQFEMFTLLLGHPVYVDKGSKPHYNVRDRLHSFLTCPRRSINEIRMTLRSRYILKADMKSYKSLETAAIFYSSEPFLKQGIS